MKLKPLACLMGLGLTAPAAAIGLGDLTVRSHLGQPLHATVEVLGAPSNLDAGCLSLRGSDNGLAVPAQARLRIERRGDRALVHITTPQAIVDPIAQFVLTSDCEGRLQREYVVLLDPPVEIEPARVAIAPPASESVPLTQARTPTGRTARTTAAASAVPPAKAAAAPDAAGAKPRPAAAKPAPKPVRQADARLVISGSTSAEAGKLPAGSDQQDVPAEKADNRPNGLSATELSDENTALNRRLAYLEAQLAALNQRNAELETRLAASRSPQPEAAPQQAPQWPLYLLGIGLLTAGGLLAAWLRRRTPARPGAVEPTLWARPRSATPGSGDTVLASPLPRFEAVIEDDMARPNPAPEAPQEAEDLPLTARTEGTDVREDILDQAEVFVAHGYANLAINLLQEHVKIAPTLSPVPWMLLLDLLSREGDVGGYAEASAECRRHFNVSIPDQPVGRDPYDTRSLESYPHVLQMLTEAWNSTALEDLFRDLIYDQRGGVRTGFEPAAFRDILLLRGIAEEKSLAMAA